MNRLWILGAADPEMSAIENLIRAAGERVEYATLAGERVVPGNAYRAELPLPSMAGGDYILVECGAVASHPLEDAIATRSPLPIYACPQAGGPILGHCPEDGHVIGRFSACRIDHHRPGDYGHGQGPDQFLPASSIGQVLSLLRGHGPAWLAPGHGWITSDGGQHEECGGQLAGMPYAEAVPAELLVVAAADHCLAAAYAGQCPGVDPQAVMSYRIETRAQFQGIAPEELRAQIEATRGVLRAEFAGGGYHCDQCGYSEANASGSACGHCGQAPSVANLTGHGELPELVEAAMIEGRAYVARVEERGTGRAKIVLGGCTTPELVTSFLAGGLVSGLVDCYGDPARGFAGGYIP